MASASALTGGGACLDRLRGLGQQEERKGHTSGRVQPSRLSVNPLALPVPCEPSRQTFNPPIHGDGSIATRTDRFALPPGPRLVSCPSPTSPIVTDHRRARCRPPCQQPIGCPFRGAWFGTPVNISAPGGTRGRGRVCRPARCSSGRRLLRARAKLGPHGALARPAPSPSLR